MILVRFISSIRRSRSFLDVVNNVKVSSGSGGDGGINFFKSLIHPLGPPCGGNGGRGGDVWIVASDEVTTLNGIKSVYRAENGKPGQRQNMHGADGKDIEIIVPIGTIVRQIDNFEPEKEKEAQSDLDYVCEHFIFRKSYLPHEDRINLLKERIPASESHFAPIDLDLVVKGQRHRILRGGAGGFGNPHFATNDIRGPGIAGRGVPGRVVKLFFELKSIADAGLVGLPNAGKSSFLKAVTNAHPKVAAYPFTTLNPYIGTIDYEDFATITLADIPGIVKGAHMNVGLGHSFCRHIERSSVLVYVIDASANDPVNDFKILQDELEKYKPGLTSKPSLILANKADLSTAEKNVYFMREQISTRIGIVPISAKKGKNIIMATTEIRKLVESQH